MANKAVFFSKLIGIAGALAVLAWPGAASSQDLTGQASAVAAVVAGNITMLADTGTLTSASDPLGTGETTGTIPGLLSAEALHAATMGWTDQVASEASLDSLSMTVAGIGITAGAVVSRALAVSGASPSGSITIDGLSIGGVSVTPSGLPNQVISLPGLTVTLNEQIATANGIVVNALRVRTLDGLTNIAVGSAQAGI